MKISKKCKCKKRVVAGTWVNDMRECPIHGDHTTMTGSGHGIFGRLFGHMTTEKDNGEVEERYIIYDED